MWPNFLCTSLMDIFPETMFAVSALFKELVATIFYRPSVCRIVATVWLLGFLMVHIPLQKVTENPALSSLLMDIKVNAISGVWIAFLNSIFDFFDLFGSSNCKSPMPMAFIDFPLAVVIVRSTV